MSSNVFVSSIQTVCCFRSSLCVAGSRLSHGLYPFFLTNQTNSATPETREIAKPGFPARPTRPTLWTYSSAVSGSVTFIKKSSEFKSIPRAATSVQIRKRTWLFLNFCRFTLRVSLLNPPPRHAEDRFSLPSNKFTASKKLFNSSQSQFVRQKISARVIPNACIVFRSNTGFIFLTRSESRDAAFPKKSFSWHPSCVANFK
mmetsp:Transcript_8016/g.30019  ORF Transcript_8016/g.30019 Transcript_8016/m.30019 type:complete len:201 (-) Transcript_8016:1619-2221(-)